MNFYILLCIFGLCLSWLIHTSNANCSYRNISLIATYYTQNSPYGVTLSKDAQTLFIAEYSAGIEIVNMANMSGPASIFNIGTPGEAKTVYLSEDEDTLYVADLSGGFWIVNITTRNHTNGLALYGGTGNGIAFSADYRTAFLAFDIAGLVILDISDPITLQFLSSFDTPGFADDVTVSDDGKVAYVADYKSGVQIINIQNNLAPTLLRSYDTPGTCRGVTLSKDNKTLYVADGATGMMILNVTDPGNPIFMGTFDTPGVAHEIVLSNNGKVAFIADETTGLVIIDISNPYNLTLLGTFSQPDIVTRSVTISYDGNTAYITDDNNAVYIVCIGDAIWTTGTTGTSGSTGTSGTTATTGTTRTTATTGTTGSTGTTAENPTTGTTTPQLSLQSSSNGNPILSNYIVFVLGGSILVLLVLITVGIIIFTLKTRQYKKLVESMHSPGIEESSKPDFFVPLESRSERKK